MEDQTNIYIIKPKRKPWNKGKLIGQKPPLQPKHVWAIRTVKYGLDLDRTGHMVVNCLGRVVTN